MLCTFLSFFGTLHDVFDFSFRHFACFNKDKRKNRPKKAHSFVKNPDKSYKQQSISLFTSLKADTNDNPNDADLDSFIKNSNNNNYNNNKKINKSFIDSQLAFTSLKSSESDDDYDDDIDDNNDTNLGDTQSAYTFPPFNPFTANPSGKKTVDGLPGAPQDLKAPIVKGRFVILSWKPPVENAEVIQSYSVYYRQEGSDR